ncbi:hypothetical protein MAR_036336 [Mya arenaria]|uniref:Uncharacterized protein n=1 Tax=Mya arenaria TaxID=6604 RepID=A0ABY7EPT2_MYAAR|nr:hypothetical protein MAR_036336 [Mya arenaria]
MIYSIFIDKEVGWIKPVFSTITSRLHSYFIETQPTVWGNASCQIAFPVLNFSGSTPSIDSTEDISNLTIPGLGVWIGYYKAMVTYTYVGNGRRDQYEGQIYDVQSLGDCISATGCKTFGLWKSNTGLTCKCALGYTVFANISCDSHCNDSNFEFPCGMAETNIMSVYNTDNERRSTAGLAAGLSVSLVLLILGAIIVLLFLKRRGFLPECHKQTEETSNHSADTATDNSFMSTPIFESTTNTMHDMTASNHTYLALERTFDGVNKDDADQYAELDATEFDHHDLTETPEKEIANG